MQTHLLTGQNDFPLRHAACKSGRAGAQIKGLLTLLGVGMMASPALGAYDLQNGGMEDPFASNIASPWTYYSGGTITGGTQSKETTIVHGGLSSQRLAGVAGNSSANFGIRQVLDANIGDAFTFGGWVWNDSVGTYQETSIRAAWGGGTTATTATALSTWLAASGTRQQWHQMPLAGGNATAATITVFLHSRRNSSNGSLLTYWDDVVGYHAYVPPASLVGNPTLSSFDLDVDPGGNSGNLLSEYAVTIGGGGYTLGANWLQPDGTVGTAPQWQTDSLWGTTTVLGLAPDTYTVEVKARYSGTILQETYLGAPAIVAIPEPATLALFGLGLLALIRRR